MDKKKYDEMYHVLARECYTALDIVEFADETIEPVVVGLSEEQIKDLVDFIETSEFEPEISLTSIIANWLKTQTFAAPYDIESMRIATDCHSRAAEGFKDMVKELQLNSGANTKLIAAAPDLLDALIKMEYHCEKILSGGLPDVLQKARTAIAKATQPQETI